MTEIEFSILANDHEVANRLRPIIAEFEKQKRIKVTLTPVLWSEGWSAMANIALYGHGPDVSELGNSWVSTLAAMNALQVFSPETVRALGGAEAFLKPAWQAGALRDERQAWSIPWLTYSQLLYYRKDVLDKVGLTDGAAALADPARLVQTLEHLAARGYPRALGLTTHAWAPIVHEAASWIWGAGGDFLSPTGKQAIFNQPEALQGLLALFSLRRFLVPRSSPPRSPANQFLAGDAMIAPDGPWISLHRHEQVNAADIGVMSVPGVPFIGGTSLAIWKHSRQQTAALELVRFLSHEPLEWVGHLHNDLFPTRQKSLQALAEHNALYQHALAGLQNGRSFPAVRLWGSVEEKLITALTAIWTEVLADPTTDIEASLHRQLDPLARRLNMKLEEAG